MHNRNIIYNYSIIFWRVQENIEKICQITRRSGEKVLNILIKLTKILLKKVVKNLCFVLHKYFIQFMYAYSVFPLIN